MAKSSQRDGFAAVDNVVVDELLYPRAALNEIWINRLIAVHETGAVFPKIILERGTNRLIDGRHRLEVFIRKEIERIPAEFRVYASDADLFAEAVRINTEHGQPLTGYDVKNAILRLEEMGYTRNSISDAVHLTINKIDAIVKGSASSVTTGMPVALKGGLGHMRRQPLSDKQIAVVRRYAGGQVVHHIRQIIMLLDGDMWPHESAMVRTEMDRLVSRWLAFSTSEDAATDAA